MARPARPDRQSVTTRGGDGERGREADNQVKGRAGYRLVDRHGLVIAATVDAANLMDRHGVQLRPERLKGAAAVVLAARQPCSAWVVSHSSIIRMCAWWPGR